MYVLFSGIRLTKVLYIESADTNFKNPKGFGRDRGLLFAGKTTFQQNLVVENHKKTYPTYENISLKRKTFVVIMCY